MPRKLVGYILLSFLSFSFFTIVFNIIAIAQVSAQQSPTQITQPEIVPTPTIYTAPPNTVSNQDAKLQSPTPTISETPQVLAASTQNNEQTVTATPLPTAIPTVLPTATPT